MSDPEWMQPPQLVPDHRLLLKQEQPGSYLLWPQNAAAWHNIPSELERILHQRQGTGCQIVKYVFEDKKWRFERATKSLDDIKNMVLRADPSLQRDKAAGAFFLVSSLQDEAIRSLGYWMRIPPHFFALPSAHVRVITGTKGSNCLMFSLQYMSMYRVGHKSSEALPHCRFQDEVGQQPHEWHASHVRFIFFAVRAGDRVEAKPPLGSNYLSKPMHWLDWQGLYMFDEGDDYIATKLRDWLVGVDRDDPLIAEVYQGLGQIIQDVIYIISNIRTKFLDEALKHLQVLSSKCLDEDLDPEKQLEYMRELYELFPLWSQVRRQLDGTKNLIGQVSRHEISTFTPHVGSELKVRDNRYYIKRLSVIEDQLRRCEDAIDKTKNLINLILGIASLQESRAAVKESRAANDFASSIQRITVLTFIYLPLTLASSILGMNITQITGEATHSQLWVYFTIAVALMVATFGGWYIWSLLLLPDIKQRVRKRAAMRAAAAKGV
ncbi:hypothetical protein SVAN01_01354 [Stagonosporopsis vannaccii]|nr:hypothetical protein SVAN01_01354 [Stagonosporopsis vannaccii]